MPRLRHGARADDGGGARDTDRIHLPDAPGGSPGRPRRVPRLWHGARAGDHYAAVDAHRIHLPDAPRGGARRTRRLPDLRHGAGTQDGDRRGAAEPRADRHDAALRRRDGARRPAARHRHVRHAAEPTAARHRAEWRTDVAAIRAGDAGRAVGRLAVLPARLDVAGDAPPQHVHADRHRHRRRLSLQRRRGARAGAVPGDLPWPGRRGRRLLRGRRGDNRAGPARPGARTQGARRDRARHPVAARSGAQDGAPDLPWRRARHSTRPGAARAAPARAPRREGAGRRRRARGRLLDRRIDGHRRTDPGREGGRRPAHRRHRQRHRQPDHAGRSGRRRHAAVPDRPDGRRGAAQPRADPAHGRCRRRLFRARRGARRRRDFHRLEPDRARTGLCLRAGQHGRRADHRLPLRARPGDADVDHGRHRAGRPCRRADQECRGAGGAREGRHAGRRQDRNADRGQAATDRRRAGIRLRAGRSAAPRREPREGQRAPACRPRSLWAPRPKG